MANQKKGELVSVKSLFSQDNIVKRFNDLLGNKAPGFISSVLQIVNESNLLSRADPQTVLNAAATAAILDLPINKNLGFAWIVPYEDRRAGIVVAQFQMGWKGYVQLALRSGQYARINVVSVYESQFQGFNYLTEDIMADFSKSPEGDVVGYVAYLRLINGFEKTVFWTKDHVIKHATMYSKTYGKTGKNGQLIFSPWNDENQFDAMAKKTVLKNTISKWGIMSIELTTAISADQSVQRTEGDYQFLDNEQKAIDISGTEENKERARVLEHIEKATTREQLGQVFDICGDYDLLDEYNAKWDQLPEDKKAK